MEFLEQQIYTHIWFKVCMVSIMQVKCNLHIMINNVIQNIEQIQYCTMNNYTISSIMCSNTYVTFLNLIHKQCYEYQTIRIQDYER